MLALGLGFDQPLLQKLPFKPVARLVLCHEDGVVFVAVAFLLSPVDFPDGRCEGAQSGAVDAQNAMRRDHG